MSPVTTWPRATWGIWTVAPRNLPSRSGPARAAPVSPARGAAIPVSRPICSVRVSADLFSSVGVASIATRIRLYIVLPPISVPWMLAAGGLGFDGVWRRLDAGRLDEDRMELVPASRHQQRQQQTQQAQSRQDVKNRVELEPGADQEAPQERTGDAA